MLTPRRRRIGPTAAVFPVAVVVGLLVAPAAIADEPPVECPTGEFACTVNAQRDATPGTVSTTARPVSRTTAADCRVPQGQPGEGTPVPCTARELGTWNNTDGCYYQPLSSQPARTEPVWEGHTDGAVYERTCPGVPGTGGGWVWLATPPGGAATTVDPAVLAQRAVRQLVLRGPAIAMAPPVGALGLVHVPVWMWTPVTTATWGPTSATASVPGLSVTAVARARSIAWDMGDGHVVTCHGPGTPYRSGTRWTTSPTCGHVYDRSSAGRPGESYPVTAVTTWRVTWSGGGQTGTLTVTRTSRTSVRIGEMQALA